MLSYYVRNSNNMSECGADLSKRCLIMSKSRVIISLCGVDLSKRYFKLIMSNSSLIISCSVSTCLYSVLLRIKEVSLCPYVMLTCLYVQCVII